MNPVHMFEINREFSFFITDIVRGLHTFSFLLSFYFEGG